MTPDPACRCPVPPFLRCLPATLALLGAFLGLTALRAAEMSPDRLTSRARPAAPKVRPVALRTEIATGAGQRHRVVLPGGAVLYVNQNTTVKLDAARRVRLQTGEILVETAPGKGDRPADFVVQTPRREVAGREARFAVRSSKAGTGVVVAQGRVTVSGLEGGLNAGQQLAPGSAKAAAAPRLSHLLDWSRELMSAAEASPVPGSPHAGGALVAVDPEGQEAKLSLRRYHIDVHIEDGFARTTIDQTYFNHENARLEAPSTSLCRPTPRCRGWPSPKVQRPTYRLDWPNYNAGQVNEQKYFARLLADLCRGIPEQELAGRGRKPIPLADQAFAAVLKVHFLFSARRFMGEPDAASEAGYVRPIHFNSVLNALENPALTPVLYQLIQQSALPLRTVETTFAPDSSGFCTSKFIRWFDVKYGVTREKAEWVKVHLICGVKTDIVTAAAILDKNAADCPQLPGPVQATAQAFEVREVDADKAFGSAENLELVDSLGGKLFAPLKSNAAGAAGSIFEKTLAYFTDKREEYLARYHKRSNVESVFSAIKRKFGDSVRSKTDTAMVNEALCKILAHNVCCCIAAWYELKIEPVFAPEEPAAEPRAVLRFPG